MSEGSISYRKFNELQKWEKEYVTNIQSKFRGCAILEPDEMISRVLEELSFANTMAKLKKIKEKKDNV